MKVFCILRVVFVLSCNRKFFFRNLNSHYIMGVDVEIGFALAIWNFTLQTTFQEYMWSV